MEERYITKEAVLQVLSDYWQQYKAYPLRSFFGFLLPAVGSIFVFFVPPLVVADVINIFVRDGGISFATTTGHIILFGVFWLTGEAMWRLGMHYIIRVEGRGLHTLWRTAFSRLTERDYDFYTNQFVGSLTKKALAFGRNFERFTDTMVFNVSTNIFPAVFAFVVLWTYSPWIPLLLLFWIAVAFAVGIPLIRRRANLVAARHDAGSKLVGRFADGLTNILAIKSYAKEGPERASFTGFADRFYERWNRAANYQNLRFNVAISPIYVAANVAGLMAAIFFAGRLSLEPGVIVVVYSYYAQVTMVFWRITEVYRNLEHAITESAEFTQLLLKPPAVQDKPNAQDIHITDGSVAFNDVHFAYPEQRGREQVFMEGFTFTIPGGQKVGFVGPSGGGKTTITKLLLRYIDLVDGTITVDGQDISDVTQRSLREAIAYVPQEPLLFHRSLSENIGYGNEQAGEAEIIEAAKLAHAHEFIQELPEGYDTLVGERGVKLSGGQRQRVAIARAILKNAPLLVLDEATSSLDSESEKYIQDGLKALMEDKTAIVIAHRLSTIKHLDRILVLDRGRIVQDGSHEELVRQDGVYKRLWGHQSGQFIE